MIRDFSLLELTMEVYADVTEKKYIEQVFSG